MRPCWAVGILAAIAACGHTTSVSRPPTAIERLPVLLVIDGPRLSREDTAAVANALAARIERPVRTAAAPVLDEREVRRRLSATYGRLRDFGWSEPRCAVGRAAAEALAHDAQAHYRLVLPRGGAKTPPALVATTFGAASRSVRLPLSGAGSAASRGSDLAASVARAIEPLASPPYPLWDTLARRLLRERCPVTALAVYDARLRHRPGSQDVLRSAVAPRPRPPAKATPAAVASRTEDPTARYTCKALCELHMVELCNNDRDLWTRHERSWEATPCGQMRPEPFLRACYQRQWLTGTLQDACITPCEGPSGGRARLLHLLRNEGCVRAPAS